MLTRDPINLGEALAHAREQVDAVDARVLLQHVLGVDRTYLVANAHEPLAPPAAQRYAELLARRAAGEPVAYLTGAREFYGLELAVTPDVLIPRPETELVVELALTRLAQTPAPRVLDLGTGSAAIALAIAALRSDAHVLAVDASRAALAVAEGNARRLLVAQAGRVELRESDWYANVHERDFDAIVSNPPYIAAGDSHLSQGDLRYEPSLALVSGVDGLDAIRAIVGSARAHVRAGGWLIVEHGYDQAERCRALFSAAGFAQIESARDLAGIERVTSGRAV